jgi:uncharacterized protein YbjT (DUF2867 family)
MKTLNAIVLGATGATGQVLLDRLLKDANFSSVSIFVRRKPKINHKKLTVYEIDFSKIEDYKELITGDVLFSCLGTTLKNAGSKDKQYLVDYTYQYEFAKTASGNGVSHYSLVSSAGANANTFFFYPKIKGELEEAVKKLSFKTIHIFQPPILIRQKNLIRTGEEIAIKILKKLNRLRMLKSQKPLHVSVLANRMINEIKGSRIKEIRTFSPKELG